LAYALSGQFAEALPLFEQMVEQEMTSTPGNAPLLYYCSGPMAS
jgi:hypothetical protein